MNAAEAISAVAQYIHTAGLNYPTEGLVADRSATEWSVYAVTNGDGSDPERGQVLSAERAGFLVSDSGDVEQVSSASSQTGRQPFTEIGHAVSGISSLPAGADSTAQFTSAFDAAVPAATINLDGVDDGHDEVAADDHTADRAAAVANRVVQQLAALGPDEWVWYRGEFAYTVSAEMADVSFETSDGGQLRLAVVPEDVMALVREQRAISAEMPAGPWWRLIIEVDNDEMVIGYDYGDDPFPHDQLQPAQNYRDDIAVYPRASLPVWLAAYLAGPNVQRRDPRTADFEVSADVAAGRVATLTDAVAPLEDIWARWAVLAALHMGVQSEEGPRITPGLGWYESDERSGATLVLLSGDRAVLSGGWWDSPMLEAAYLENEPLPDLFAGAPVWVNDAVLNVRSQHGLMSFCYWWADRQWWRGATDTIDELDMALPPVWSIEETLAEMANIVEAADDVDLHSLLAAATDGAITVDQVIDVFASDPEADVDAALNQLAAAGVIR